MGIRVTPLSPALGAEIGGADIAGDLLEKDLDKIRQAWFEHGLILLHGQDITEDQQVAFGSAFGPLAPWSRFADKMEADDKRNPYIMLITNKKENGEYVGSLPDGEIEFHSDGIYIEEPLAATMLFCVQPTSMGGQTAFSNMYKAYESLPGDIKARIDGRKALHAFTYNSARRDQNSERKTNWDDVAHFIHPIVRTHPVTGRKALYVNRLMTQEIVDMAPDDSDALLEVLYRQIERPEFIYEHNWRKGDILLWDNRCLAHARRDFPAGELRMMKRLTIQGERPV